MIVTKEPKSKDEAINVDTALAALKNVEDKTASNQKLESAVKRVRRDLTLYKEGGDLNLYEIPNFIRDVETIVNSSNLSSEEKERFAAQMDGFQDFLEDRGIVVEKEPEKKNVVKPHHSSTFKKVMGTALLGAALFNFTGLTPKAEAQSAQTAQTTQTQTAQASSEQATAQNYWNNDPQMQNLIKAQNMEMKALQEAQANQLKVFNEDMKDTIKTWQSAGMSKKEIRKYTQRRLAELTTIEENQDASVSALMDQQAEQRTELMKQEWDNYYRQKNPQQQSGAAQNYKENNRSTNRNSYPTQNQQGQSQQNNQQSRYYPQSGYYPNQQQNNNYQNQNASQQQLSPQEQQAQYMKSQEDMQEKQMEMEMQMQKQQAEEQMKIYHQQMVDSTISNLAVYGGMMGLARAFY